MKLSMAIAGAIFLLVSLIACDFKPPGERAGDALDKLIEDAEEDVFGTPTPQTVGVPVPPCLNAPLTTPPGTLTA